MSERYRIELRIKRELKEQVDAACAARGSTMSGEIRAFLERLVKRASKEVSE